MRRSRTNARNAAYGCEIALRNLETSLLDQNSLRDEARRAIEWHRDAIGNALTQLERAESYKVGDPSSQWPQKEQHARDYLSALAELRRTKEVLDRHLTIWREEQGQKKARKEQREKRRKRREFLKLGKQLKEARERERQEAKRREEAKRNMPMDEAEIQRRVERLENRWER